MSRVGDVLYFLRQIFFPNWKEREDEGEPTGLQKILVAIFLYLASRNGTGTLFSVILHAFILAVLSLIMIPKMSGFTGIDILSSINVPGIEEQVFIAPLGDSHENGEQHVALDVPTSIPDVTTQDEHPTPAVETSGESGAETVINLSGEERQQLEAKGGFVLGGGLQNRSPAGRQRAMQGGGACQRGEDAIEAALMWLAAHQQADGGWSLYFEDSCGRCSHSGTGRERRRTAATALALLSFLGAGYSQQEPSRYQKVVDDGLLFLIRDPNGGINGAAIQRDQLRMYSYGLAAIALCEAYAMSRQNPTSELAVAAQRALWRIETAQTAYGGWNYRPDQTTRDDGVLGGDTSIFSWQLMALKSGQLGGLHVSQSVLYGAQDFLSLVALDGGRRYRYNPMGIGSPDIHDDSPNTCTAIGLLSRMYLGWQPGDPFLDDGMGQIVRWGYTLREGEVNLYYAYFAALALHHYGGEHWDEWNSGVRELLIQSQSRQGCESGSWFFRDPYCDSGGRLLNTALAVMILETPYRFMPLYRDMQ